MTRLASRLLVLLAVLLMPLGMATAATPVHHGQLAAAMPMEHCPDETSQHEIKGGLAACTTACSAALPAVAFAGSGFTSLASVILAPASTVFLHGIQPETVTPPPRLS